MGRSATGIICFGVPFNEGTEFPWDEGHDGDVNDWWYFGVHGKDWKPSFVPFTEDGQYAPGVTKDDPRFEQWHKEKDEHKAKCPPVPFAAIDFCDTDYPMTVIAVCGSEKRAYDGPDPFDPSVLTLTAATVEDFVSALGAHLEPWLKENQGEDFKPLPKPAWLFGAYYG